MPRRTLYVKCVCLELSTIVIQRIYLAILLFPRKALLLKFDSRQHLLIQCTILKSFKMFMSLSKKIYFCKSKKLERAFVKLNILSVFVFNSLTYDLNKNSRTFLKWGNDIILVFCFAVRCGHK